MSAEPEERYQRYIEDFGRRLGQAAAIHARRRRRRGPLAVGAATATAAAIVGAVLLVGSGGGGGLDVVARARAALAPGDRIVHLVMSTSTEPLCHPNKEFHACVVPQHGTVEQWSTAHPYRGHTRAVLHGPLDFRFETAYGNGRFESYDARKNVLRFNHTKTGTGATGLPGGFGFFHGNPAAAVRRMLAQGVLHDAGTAQFDGQTVRRLQGTKTDDQGVVSHIVYDVDPDTFAPVDGSFTIKQQVVEVPRSSLPKLPQKGSDNVKVHAGGFVQRFKVHTYEHIPLTPKTAELLTIKTNPETKVKRAPPGSL